MSTITNDDLLARINSALKAITTSDLGDSKLTAQQTDQFLRTMEAENRLLDWARRLDMTSHTRNIDRIAMSSIMEEAPAETEEFTGGTDPDFFTNQLIAARAKGAARVGDETLEDNIEQEGFEQTLQDIIAEAAGRDLERLFLQGDTDDTGFLATTDGWFEKAAHVLDETDFDPADPEDLFEALLTSVDPKYLRDRSDWRFWVDWDVENDYRDELRSRATGLGDSAQTGAQRLAYKGIEVVEAPLVGSGRAALFHQDNTVYGIWRDIRIEPYRRPDHSRTDFFVTMRVDCHFEDENAAAVASGYTG